MTWFQTSFEWAGRIYTNLFSDWLHINYLIRTAILLAMLWLIIYVASLLFKYVLGPILVLFFVNVLLRIWNFFVTESLHEWIYINYYSNGDSRHAKWYMRLSDRVKRNRAALSYTRYKGILKRGRVRRLGNLLMVSALIIITLWVVAFGLNQEYARPAWVGVDAIPNEEDNDAEYNGDTQDEDSESPDEEYFPGILHPNVFPEGLVHFVLTQDVREDGARLRDGPGTNTVVIEMLFGQDRLTYLGYYAQDPDLASLFWLRVRTPSGTEGYIANQLVELEE